MENDKAIEAQQQQIEALKREIQNQEIIARVSSTVSMLQPIPVMPLHFSWYDRYTPRDGFEIDLPMTVLIEKAAQNDNSLKNQLQIYLHDSGFTAAEAIAAAEEIIRELEQICQ